MKNIVSFYTRVGEGVPVRVASEPRSKTFRAGRLLVLLACVLSAAVGGGLSFQEHAAVQESLSRVHPRMRASWLKERGLDDSYYTTFRRPDSQGLREIGRWSFGPSYDVDGRVTPSETLVALARGSGVSLLRFSRQDSISIELLSDINAEGLMCRVKVVDTFLYVGSRAGLEVYNIAAEQTPIRLSWTPMPLNDFDLQDSLVYTISGDDTFRIYNVSNPANPVLRGACRDSGDLVSVTGNAAFLGDRWGLYALDITNPAGPHRIGAWGSAIEQVLARGNLCYVTTFNPNQPGEITFHILDVSVPGSPAQIGSLASAGGNDVCLVDTLAFGAGENDFNKLTIVSVADSTRPHLIGSAAAPGWSMGIWASALARSAFVGCHWEGLQVFDTRNTAQPVKDTFLLGSDQSVDICIDNGRAYIANEMAGLKILDVSDPTKPVLLGSYDTTWQRPFMSAVVARDSFAYIEWSRPKFRTLEVTDPTRPRYAGTCELFGYPEDMVIRDSFVYCAEASRFQIVNVARPREPVMVGTCAGDGVAIVAVSDTFLYIPYVYDTLFTYSVSNPAQPRLLSAVQTGVWPWDVALAESRAFVALSDGYGVEVFDLVDPGRPVRRGRTGAPGDVRRLCYSNGLLYAAMWEAGVAIYETTSTAVGETGAAGPRRPDLRIWPSVVTDYVRFTVDRTTRELDIAVFDISGMRLGNVTVQAETKGGATQGRIGFVGLPAGVYVVRVSSEATNLTAKVVRTKGR